MKDKQTLFVDFEQGNVQSIKRLIDVMRDGKLGADIATIEREFRDVNVYAIVGYALNYGFYSTSRDLEYSDRVLARGTSRDLTSSYFMSGVIQIERGDRNEGMRFVELAAQRDYPPALFMLGMNHLSMKWENPDEMFGYKCLFRASKQSYLPAKILLFHRQSQAPYKKWVRLKSIVKLLTSLYVTKVLDKFIPFSKSLSFFREL